jgi:CRP-like cAMP-binding protein
MSSKPAERARNRLLARLQPQDYARLQPHLKQVSFPIGTVLYEARSTIETIYFPHNCVLSALAITGSGDAIETGTVGNEGACGFTGFLGPCISPNRTIVQIAGDAESIDASVLATEVKSNSRLFDLMVRHHQAFLSQITQSVACNGLHGVFQRCCRWLLMTHDRVDGDDVPLTHEFLAMMLAVRRQGVTESIHTLEKQGCIQNSRAVIHIRNRAGLESASCDCYGIVVEEYKRLLGS